MTDFEPLRPRIRLLALDDDVRFNIEKVSPVLEANLDTIISKFYKHLKSFPECKALFDKYEFMDTLPERQKKHWLDLFSCQFDEAFAKRAFAIGRAHFKFGVAPYLYISGYTFFHCELIRVVSERHDGALDLPSMITAVTRVIHLDMDLSLSAYTKAYWTNRAAAE